MKRIHATKAEIFGPRPKASGVGQVTANSRQGMSIAEAAKVLGASEREVRAALRTGKLRAAGEGVLAADVAATAAGALKAQQEPES